MSRNMRYKFGRFFPVIVLAVLVISLVSTPSLALIPPDPPDPPGGDPPPPPPFDYEGAEPGNENVILPPPETIVYDASEPSGELTCSEIDPETGQPVSVRYANDELSIVFAPEATTEEIDSALASIGAWKKMNIQATGEWVAGIQPVATCEDLQAKIAQVLASPLVISAAGNPLGDLTVIEPNDTLYPPPSGYDPNLWGQWNLRRMGLPTAWQTELGKLDFATVGIVDTGVQKNHPDLAANLLPESDPPSIDPINPPWHGTACTGIIGAVTNNSLGVAGLLWNTRCVTKSGGSYLRMSKVSDKVLELARMRPGLGDVHSTIVAINMSIAYQPGNYSTFDLGKFENAVNEALRQGMLVVASMGNSGGENKYWPAAFTRAMGIGAVDRELFFGSSGPEFRADFSTYGQHTSVVAPGVEVATTFWNSIYTGNFDGTSAAAPHVSGLAALIRSEFQSMGLLDIRHRIEDTASDYVTMGRDAHNPWSGWDKWTGWGSAKADTALASTTASYTISGNKWHLITLPVWPKENDTCGWYASGFPQNVFPTVSGAFRRIHRLKAGTNQYYTQSQYDSSSLMPLIGTVKPYRAYWVNYVNYSGNVTINADGAIAGQKASHLLEFPLTNGYNMIGNPFLGQSIYFSDSNVSFRMGNEKLTYTLSQAIGKGWIGKCWFWDPDEAVYRRAYPNASHAMPPFKGYMLWSDRENLYMLVKR